jgi:hypothetical protein
MNKDKVTQFMGKVMDDLTREQYKRKKLVLLNELHVRVFVKSGLSRKEANKINKFVEEQMKWAVHSAEMLVSHQSKQKVIMDLRP